MVDGSHGLLAEALTHFQYAACSLKLVPSPLVAMGTTIRQELQRRRVMQSCQRLTAFSGDSGFISYHSALRSRARPEIALLRKGGYFVFSEGTPSSHKLHYRASAAGG